MQQLDEQWKTTRLTHSNAGVLRAGHGQERPRHIVFIMRPQHGQQAVHHFHLQRATHGFILSQKSALQLQSCKMSHFCPQVVCDSARNRVTCFTGWFVLQSAGRALKKRTQLVKKLIKSVRKSSEEFRAACLPELQPIHRCHPALELHSPEAGVTDRSHMKYSRNTSSSNENESTSPCLSGLIRFSVSAHNPLTYLFRF